MYIKGQAANIEEVFSTLTDREREVLKLRFGLQDGRSRTLEEIGRRFNVTRERIRQIEAKALRKLRHHTRRVFLKQLVGLPHEGIRNLLCRVSPRLVESGELKPVGQPITETASKKCKACGQLIPRGRRAYCSSECFKKWWSCYRNWPEERKLKHKDLVERWRKEHPQQAMMIQKKATYTRRRKLAKLQSFEDMISQIISSQEN